MFLQSVTVLETEMCVQEPEKFIAITRASTDLGPVLPYLNAIIRPSFYSAEACSLMFKRDAIEFTLVKDQINIKRFINRTELLELLDWVQDLVNDTYESMDELTPDYTERQPPPVLTIYKLLPRTNCRQCGEKSCMAFATRLNKMEVEIERCAPLLEQANRASRLKLEECFA